MRCEDGYLAAGSTAQSLSRRKVSTAMLLGDLQGRVGYYTDGTHREVTHELAKRCCQPVARRSCRWFEEPWIDQADQILCNRVVSSLFPKGTVPFAFLTYPLVIPEIRVPVPLSVTLHARHGVRSACNACT